jgi:NurA-like 5'-3' nuclease
MREEPELRLAVCTWPDGQIRDVAELEDDGENAKVIWNEKVERVNRPHKDVVGFDEIVPSEWLKYVRQQTTGRNDHTGTGSK